MIRYRITRCSLGQLIVGWSEEGLKAIELGDNEEELLLLLHAHFPRQTLEHAPADNSGILAQVARFLDEPRGVLEQPLAPQGSPFQCEVWRALQTIPAGKTLSYGELARKLGKPKAARAVANACAANTLAVAIPCHRVVRTDGALGGYRWGIERKRALLTREANQTATAAHAMDNPPT